MASVFLLCSAAVRKTCSTPVSIIIWRSLQQVEVTDMGPQTKRQRLARSDKEDNKITVETDALVLESGRVQQQDDSSSSPALVSPSLSHTAFCRGHLNVEQDLHERYKEEKKALAGDSSRTGQGDDSNSTPTPVTSTLSHTTFSSAYLDIEQGLCKRLMCLRYGEAVKYVYNPVDYARELHEDFIVKFCRGQKKVLLLGMNPGPWGMGQTGVPFGHVGYAKDWLGVQGQVQRPAQEHPKRPVLGLACPRNEVSGDRMWSLLKELSGTPSVLFTHVFLHNYCPVFFLKDSAKNVTPPELKAKERSALEEECDKALVAVVQLLGVEHLIGVGKYATDRAVAAFRQAAVESVKVSTLMHPSPINPAANKGWRDIAIKQLTESGAIHYFKLQTSAGET